VVTLAIAIDGEFAWRDVRGFVACQCLGAAVAVAFVRWLEQRPKRAVQLTAQASPAVKSIDL